MKQVLLPSLELAILIINFISSNLKIVLKMLQIENFKKHLMTKKILLTTRQPKKFGNIQVRAKAETKTIPKSLKTSWIFFVTTVFIIKLDMFIIFV